MYWPKGLPCENGEYYGSFELVASNDLGIVNGNSLAGDASVVHWLEQKDDPPGANILFWRQKFCRRIRELSVSISLPFAITALL
jgi:hypothetical protein